MTNGMDKSRPATQTSSITTASLTVEPGQRFVYQLDDSHVNLVLPADMEAAIRLGEIENLLISIDGTTVLIQLKDGPSLTLKSMKSPTMEDGLLEGGGQDEEILIKQRQTRPSATRSAKYPIRNRTASPSCSRRRPKRKKSRWWPVTEERPIF